MSKKRQDLELELRKLDIDKHHVDVRIRSIEQSPRNQRILKGDFSAPPRREGDTRRFTRGGGDSDDTSSSSSSSKRTREEEGEKEKEKNGDNNSDDKEKEKEDEDGNNKEETPSVLSAVVVGNEDTETKEAENTKPERGAGSKRKLGGNAEISKRDKLIFKSLLMGHLNKAQDRLKVDRENKNLKKKEELEAKVNQKISQRTVGIREKEAEHLAQQRDQEKKLRDDIVRKAEAKRRELDELIANEHEESLGHFIRTQTEPFVYYLPASHIDKTRKLLAKTKEYHESRIADGSAMLEKDLDQGFIDALMEYKGGDEVTPTTEKDQEKDQEKQEKDQEKQEKDQEKDQEKKEGSEKEGEKEKEQNKDDKSKDSEKNNKRGSPPKKSRKKAKEDSSSSSSDSSDSD